MRRHHSHCSAIQTAREQSTGVDTVLCAVAARAVGDDMFLTPRFVPKTIEELRGQGTDAAELARQEARLKQQVHCRHGWPAQT